MLLRRIQLLALTLLLLGCQKAQDPRLTSLDQAIDRGYRFLLSKQTQDGHWTSRRYPFFQDGYSLTALAGTTLIQGQQDQAAINRARTFVATLTDRQRDKLLFPAYVVAESLVLFGADKEPSRAHLRGAGVEYLRGRQMVEALGWSPDDVSFGGWGEANQVYPKPKAPRKIDVNRLADLSSTLFVVSALKASGVPSDDPAIRNSLQFVERCQNFDPPAGGTKDGGFFFCPGGSSRNKAGKFNSYGSTTADGIRALMQCGLPSSDARIVAARRWLIGNFDAHQVAGDFPSNKATLRQGLYFYYCASAAVALQDSGSPVDEVTWARNLCDALVPKQKEDGSWSNPVPIYCEDDPVLGTVFVLRSLVATRQALSEGPAAR